MDLWLGSDEPGEETPTEEPSATRAATQALAPGPRGEKGGTLSLQQGTQTPVPE